MAYGAGQDGVDDDGNLWPPEYAKAVEDRDALLECLSDLCETIEKDGGIRPRVERGLVKAQILIAKMRK